ncbi:hypothetical protein C8Q74DRAFT_771634 [Fomes fomentarius]|nr:hypothetical protein C8Q74DRAFT_771634 [Fomes fomentarius]
MIVAVHERHKDARKDVARLLSLPPRPTSTTHFSYRDWCSVLGTRWASRLLNIYYSKCYIAPPFIEWLTGRAYMHTHCSFSLLTRVSLTVADGIVVAVIGRLWLIMRRARWQDSSRRSSFLDLLFRDGSIFFLVQAVLNAVQIITTALQVGTANGAGPAPIGDFVTVLTAIFLSRSLFNLQHLDRGVIDPTLTDPSFWAAAISESDSEGSVDIAADIMLVELEGGI